MRFRIRDLTTVSRSCSILVRRSFFLNTSPPLTVDYTIGCLGCQLGERVLLLDNARFEANRRLSPFLAELGDRAFVALFDVVPSLELLEEFFCYIPGVLYGDSCNHDLGRGLVISEVVEPEFLSLGGADG